MMKNSRADFDFGHLAIYVRVLDEGYYHNVSIERGTFLMSPGLQSIRTMVADSCYQYFYQLEKSLKFYT